MVHGKVNPILAALCTALLRSRSSSSGKCRNYSLYDRFPSPPSAVSSWFRQVAVTLLWQFAKATTLADNGPAPAGTNATTTRGRAQHRQPRSTRTHTTSETATSNHHRTTRVTATERDPFRVPTVLETVGTDWCQVAWCQCVSPSRSENARSSNIRYSLATDNTPSKCSGHCCE